MPRMRRRALDLGHDPLMGPALEALSLELTGNVHPATPVPEVAWSISVFDLEQGFPFADGTFDVVTAFEVIEHVRSTPLALLRESFRVLRPGGLLYLGTPSVVAWAKIRRMFSQVHPYDTSAYSLNFSTTHPMCHVYEWDPWTLKKVVQSQGFDIAECRTWDVYESDPSGLRNVVLRVCVTASLLAAGMFKDAAQIWRLRGHQIGLAARKPGA
jgi:SAM-dependent methyltransferase